MIKVGLHVKGQLHLGLVVRVINLEEAMHKLLEVDVAAAIQVKNREESLSDNAWQLRVL